MSINLLRDSTFFSIFTSIAQNLRKKIVENLSIKGVGVADLRFCYADYRPTGSGNDSKTFEA
jgi:hypothetical protein